MMGIDTPYRDRRPVRRNAQQDSQGEFSGLALQALFPVEERLPADMQRLLAQLTQSGPNR